MSGTVHSEIQKLFFLVHGHYATFQQARRILEADTSTLDKSTRIIEKDPELTVALENAEYFLVYLFRNVAKVGDDAQAQQVVIESSARLLFDRTEVTYEAVLTHWERECKSIADKYCREVLPHRDNIYALRALGAPTAVEADHELEEILKLPHPIAGKDSFDAVGGNWQEFFDRYSKMRTRCEEFVKRFASFKAEFDKVRKEESHLEAVEWSLTVARRNFRIAVIVGLGGCMLTGLSVWAALQ